MSSRISEDEELEAALAALDQPEPPHSRAADGVNNGSNRFGFPGKPNIGRIGTAPPPEARNGLRNLSAVPVVRIASGSEVLLPGHVPHHLEQQGTQPDNGLRRRISGPGSATAWTCSRR